jgi:hypothetical protein
MDQNLFIVYNFSDPTVQDFIIGQGKIEFVI